MCVNYNVRVCVVSGAEGGVPCVSWYGLIMPTKLHEKARDTVAFASCYISCFTSYAIVFPFRSVPRATVAVRPLLNQHHPITHLPLQKKQELYFDYFPPVPSSSASSYTPTATTTYTTSSQPQPPPLVNQQQQQCAAGGDDASCKAKAEAGAEQGQGQQPTVVLHAHHHYPSSGGGGVPIYFPQAAVDFLSKTDQWLPSPLAKVMMESNRGR